MKKSKKIRNQLLIILSLFTASGVAITLVSLHYFKKVHEIYKVNSAAHMLYESYINTINAEQKFIHLETSKIDFFRTGQSDYLDDFNHYLIQTRFNLSNLKNRSAYGDFEIDDKVEILSNELSKFETLFSFTLDKVTTQGFKDFGTEGKMRSYAHEMERRSSQIGLANVLMLRRHEKDFLLRNDESYIKKLKSKISAIKETIWKNKNLQNHEKDTLIMLLHHYQYSFLELVKVTREIGYKSEEGMTEQLSQCNNNINRQFGMIHSAILKKGELLITNVEKIFMIVIFNIVIVCIFTIYFYTRKAPVVLSLASKQKQTVSEAEKNYEWSEIV